MIHSGCGNAAATVAGVKKMPPPITPDTTIIVASSRLISRASTCLFMRYGTPSPCTLHATPGTPGTSGTSGTAGACSGCSGFSRVLVPGGGFRSVVDLQHKSVRNGQVLFDWV